MRLNRSPSKFRKKKSPEKKDQYWPYIKNHHDTGMEIRRHAERRWIVSLAFLVGRQYTFFNTDAHALQELGKLGKQTRQVDNQLFSRWRRQVSDLVKNNPQMSVVPNSTDDEDIKAAKVGTKVLLHFWRQNKMKKKIRQLAGWMYSCGNVFIDDRWEDSLGPTAVNKETGDLEYLGDVDCGIWSPFEIVVPSIILGDNDIHSQPWIQKFKYRTLDWIAKKYKRGSQVTEEQMTFPIVDMGAIMGHPTGTNVVKHPGAIVIEHYEQPSVEFPRGAFITGANGVVLNKQDFPFNHYFIEHFKDIDVPGSFWGRATMEDAIPLQKIWNRLISSVDDYNRTMAKGKWLSPRGAKLASNPDDTHGEVVHYKPVMGHKPEHVSLKGLPNTYPLIMQSIQGSLQDLFSQHEISRGTNKSDIRSGEMVSLLREQDAHGNIPSHLVFEESLEAVMSRVLKRIQTGYKSERMIQVTGRDGEFDIFAFQGSDLRNNTDVSVKRQSSLPDSKIAREAMVMQRFEQGLYGDPADPEVRRHVMNMVDDAMVKDIYSDTQLDETYARFENKMMKKGYKQLLVNQYDNHQIHVKEHNHDRKSMEFQKLKITNPQVFRMIDTIYSKHNQFHQKFIDAQMKQLIAQQMMLKGGPDEKRSSGGKKLE